MALSQEPWTKQTKKAQESVCWTYSNISNNKINYGANMKHHKNTG